MRPIVGVMPLWDDDKESLWMLPGYLDGLEDAGATPVVFPLIEDKDEIARLVDMCDGILLTGGHDVTPGIYGEVPLAGTVSCAKRDHMEKLVLEDAMLKDKPVLGICRGIQLVNALLGGTLYQDLPTQRPSQTDHHQTPPYDVPVHEVVIKEGTPLFECLGLSRIKVNSYHHQAVKDLAPGLKAMAVSSDRIIEAVYMPDHPFLWAVQWHPEFSWKTDAVSRLIFDAFIRKMQ